MDSSPGAPLEGPAGDRSQGWIETLAELRAARRPCALVVVAHTVGSAPREPGARMIVCDGRIAWGTIGGGNLEHQALARASELLKSGRAVSETREVPLGEAAGQCCGGVVTLFLETFPWRRRTVAVFGAGHVGQALAGLAPWLEADVVVIDPREEHELTPRPPRERPWRLLATNAPEAEVATLPADALVVVMTHSHALDLEVVAAALARRAFPWVGLIGSERKWARFRKRLAQRGFAPAEIESVRCPIGVSRASKHPRAIALSAATELVEVLERLEARLAGGERADAGRRATGS